MEWFAVGHLFHVYVKSTLTKKGSELLENIRMDHELRTVFFDVVQEMTQPSEFGVIVFTHEDQDALHDYIHHGRTNVSSLDE